MARKYDYTFGTDKTGYGWAMEECEESLLWSAISEIEARIPPDQTGKKLDFYDQFFEKGQGVTLETLDWINSIRKRASLSLLNFQETHIGDYGRMSDRAQKAALRQRMRDDYFLMDTAGRMRWRREAEEDIARLFAPHFTLDEVRERRKQFTPTTLTPKEQAMCSS